MAGEFIYCKLWQTQFLFQVLVEDRILKLTSFEEVSGPNFIGKATGKASVYNAEDIVVFDPKVDGRANIALAHERKVIRGEILDQSMAGKYFVPISSSCLSFDDRSFPIPLWYGTMLVIAINSDGVLTAPGSVQNLAKEQAVSGKRYLQQQSLKSVLLYTARAEMKAITDGFLGLFCGEEYAFITNHSAWANRSNLQSAADEVKAKLPKLRCVSSDPLPSDRFTTVTLELHESTDHKPISCDLDLVLTPICGYLPKLRLRAEKGVAKVPVLALGLSKGDELQFWVGVEANRYLAFISKPIH